MKGLATACISALALCAHVSSADEDWSRIYLGSNPSVAGDGRSFVFEWNDHLWLASTSGGHARRLGTGSSADSWPVMNMDGTKVAFSSDRDGGSKVFVFDIKGETVRQVSYHSEATWPRAWMPDGRGLVCLGYRDSSGPKTCQRAIMVRTDERKAERIPFDVPADDPVVSPDGSSMLFTRRGDEQYRKRPHSIGPVAGQIWMFKFATREFTPMIVHKTDCRNAQWLPDGSGFYYLDAVGGVRNVWRHDIATGAETQLTFFKDDHVFQPSLSADGRTMLFRQKFDFWRFDPTVAGAKPVRIILRPEPGYVERGESRRRYYTSCWNNDSDGDVTFCDNGMQIAFTTGGDLYVMDTVICEPTLVHGATRTHERECVFSPDGSALYFLCDRGDLSSVVKAVPDDPTKPWWENTKFIEKTVVGFDAQKMGLSISPDGRRLAWQDPNGVFVFADVDGGNVVKGPPATQGGAYAWSPDGRYVAAQLADEFANFDVWIVSTDGSREPYNLSRNFKYDGEPAWSPDGKMIAFVSERPEFGDGKFLRYVYLDRAIEEVETYVYEIDKSRKTIRENAVDSARFEGLDLPGERFVAQDTSDIDFTDLSERVRTVRIGAFSPFFKWDSRTIAFGSASGQTDTIRIPDRMKPERLFSCTGTPRAWVEKGDRVLWIVDRLPAHGERKFGFSVYQNTNYEDYQELAFRTAWARIRDTYYDPGVHGADWPGIGYRFIEPVRHASSYSVFIRIMNMVLGELDSSHLGFYADDSSRREWARKTQSPGWTEATAHLGLRFERDDAPDGWVVRDVIPGGPADRRGFNMNPGDVVTAIDGTKVGGGVDPTTVLNGPEKRKVRVTFRRSATGAIDTVVVPSCSFTEARKLIGREELRAKRRSVHELSGGKFGYLNIDAMNWESFWTFQHDVFSEGYGRDGLIIDVRHNYGGFTADQMLQILLGGDHSRAVTRTCGAGYLFGYWGRPVWSKPIVVLCNEYTGSNGEIFSHAIKTLKRGKLVGRETGGGVIGTYDKPLLDLGSFRDARYGWFVLDGTDMEHHGAKPDVEVDDLPADIDAGVDRQLEKAIDVLSDEVDSWQRSHPPVDFKFAR